MFKSDPFCFVHRKEGAGCEDNHKLFGLPKFGLPEDMSCNVVGCKCNDGNYCNGPKLLLIAKDEVSKANDVKGATKLSAVVVTAALGVTYMGRRSSGGV